MEIKKYSDISASLNGGANSMGWTNTMIRSNALPIDSKSIFKSMADAEKYINESKLAYEGQIVAVTEDGKQVAYVVDTTADNGLRRVGSDPTVISGEISSIAASYALSAENVARTELSIAMTTAAGTGDILSTYTFTQGGTTVGTVSIPKDKVISAAHMVTVTGNYDETKTPAELSSFTVRWNDYTETVTETSKPGAYAAIMQAYTGPEGGDGSYIRIVVTNAEAAPVYIAVPKLVDTYVGVKSDTIEVKVVGNEGETREISAIINTGSVGAEHLTTGLSTYIKNVVDAQAADRAAIEILSGDDTAEGSVKKALKDAKAYTDSSVDTLSTGLDAKIQKLSADLSSEIDILSTSLSTTVDEKIKGITDNYALSADVSTISGSLFDKIETDVKTLSTSLSTTVDAKDEALEKKLSTYTETYTDGKILDLSTSLSTTVDSKLTALENTLSTYTETQVETLSTSLSTTVDEKIKAITDNYALSSDVSDISSSLFNKIDTDVKALSTSLSTTVDAKVLKLSADLSGEIDKLSTSLSTTTKAAIEAEATARDTADKWLSNDYVAKISDLSTSLSTTVDAKLTTLENTLSTYTETQVEALSTSLSNTVVADYAKYTDVQGGKAALTGDNKIATMADIVGLSGSVHVLGTIDNDESTSGKSDKTVIVETYPKARRGALVINVANGKEYICMAAVGATAKASDWEEIGDQNLYATKAELTTETNARKADDLVLSNAITAEVDRAKAAEAIISNDLSTLSDAYETFVGTTYVADKAAIESASSEISGKVDNKVKVGTGSFDGTTWTDTLANKTSLSVVKIADEDYYKLVSAGKQDNDVIYIVSSDYINGHDQRIINVGAALSATDAVNLSGMTAAIDAAKAEIVATSLSGVTLNGASFEVANNVASLEISCINCGNAN